MMNDAGHELSWDAEIRDDGNGSWVLLEPGEYDFKVTGFARKRFPGSAKLPPCNQAALTLEVWDAEGRSTQITHNLFLHTKTEGLLCAFFRAIGARKHGDRYVMDWSMVPGATGRCKLGVRTWTGRNGESRKSNEVTRFLDPQPQGSGKAPSGAEKVNGPAAEDDLPF